MSEEDWDEATHHASRSEVRRLLAQLEADERYGIDGVFEVLQSFKVKSVAQLSIEELDEMSKLLKKLIGSGEGI